MEHQQNSMSPSYRQAAVALGLRTHGPLGVLHSTANRISIGSGDQPDAVEVYLYNRLELACSTSCQLTAIKHFRRVWPSIRSAVVELKVLTNTYNRYFSCIIILST